MADINGTGDADKIDGGKAADTIYSQGGDDTVNGGKGNDSLFGGNGNDSIAGQSGDDLISGGKGMPGALNLDKLVMTEDYKGSVTFLSESAGYRNTLGMYKIDAKGNIYGVQVLFANASLKGSGGDLEGGKSKAEFAVKAGEKIAFFVVPDAFSSKTNAEMLSSGKGSFELRDAKGQPGTVNGGELALTYVLDGKATAITSAHGTSTYHSFMGDTRGVNGDGLDHVHGEVNKAEGNLKIGFEDLWNGGDRDFDDSVFVVNIGVNNANGLKKPSVAPAPGVDDDILSGGEGNDVMYGMRGSDKLAGDNGNDKMWGGSGNDWLSGDVGNDNVSGDSGNDEARGGEGDDLVTGGSGDDRLQGEAGNDRMVGGSGNDTLDGGKGNDALDAGSGNDWLVASSGGDKYLGGSGSDTLDLSGLGSKAVVDLSKSYFKAVDASGGLQSMENVVGTGFADQIRGSKAANAIDGGDGADWIRGAEGSDVMKGGFGADDFVLFKKDVADGSKLGSTDTILDFDVKQGDQLMLHDLVKGGDASKIFSVEDTKAGLMISAEIKGVDLDVVLLADVHGLSLKELIAMDAIVL